MQIEGSIRTNLIAAVASARRWKGRAVHKDTINHWRSLIEHARRGNGQPWGEPVNDLVAELETEMLHIKAEQGSR